VAKVIITMPDDFLIMVDEEAKAEHRSRSEFVREALRRYLAECTPGAGKEQNKEIQEAVRRIDEARKRSTGSKVKGSEIIRQWRYRLDR